MKKKNNLLLPISIVSSSYEVKGSKFLAFLVPYTNFDNILEELKEKHPKACHFVTAFRFFSCHINEGCSDDGEPKGSAGIPILKVLRGEQIVDVGLIVVRYFGGTLLGVGGLVRAYTQSVKNVIMEAHNQNMLVEYCTIVDWDICVGYTLLSQILCFCQKKSIEIKEKKFYSDRVLVSLRSSLEKQESFYEKFQGL